jgi:hypothetical protein
MGIRGSFRGGEADHSPPSSVEVKEWVELYLHSSNTRSWRGAQLKKNRDSFTFILYVVKYILVTFFRTPLRT